MATSNSIPSAQQATKPPLYKFLLSGEIDLPVAFRLLAVETRLNADCYVTAQLFADNKPLCPAVTSSFGSFTTNGQYSWNQRLRFPVTYAALPLRSQLVITLWTTDMPAHRVPLGGTTMALFGRNRTLRLGRQKLYMWPGKEGDGKMRTDTPGKMKAQSDIDRLEKLIKKYERGQLDRVAWLDRLTFQAIEKLNVETPPMQGVSGHSFLFLELPDYEYPVVFHQKAANIQKSVALMSKNTVVMVYDPEAMTDSNPVEEKHHTMMRASKRRPGLGSDKDLKPNLDERARLTQIVNYPPTQHLSEDEKELIWKYRYFLMMNKRALTKFVKSVDWSRTYDQAEAYSLIEKWEPIDVDDALELLTSAFAHLPKLRQYAVKRLDHFPDEELQYYLIQLVQALRYDKGTANSDLCNFLIRKGCANQVIGNYLYWYIKVETEDPNASELFQRILKDFLTQLGRLAGKEQVVQDFQQQEYIISQWIALTDTLRKQHLPRSKKIEKAKELVKDGEFSFLSNFKPLTFPLDPSHKFVGIRHEDLYFFKSKLEPMLMTALTPNGQPYQLIFKIGDDLRQDQLIVQMITLMDRLLKRENLDLQLLPYKVLATSRSIGMLECVPKAKNISDVVKEYGNDTLSLQRFLAKHNPDSSGPFGISPRALNNFVRSCAGYCVITFILGIGDRHLDNVLMTYDGHMFHIDFGFVLGRDPKPFAPPFKLSPQMVECMGGNTSSHYNDFKTYCCEAFNILRKHASLILNMFSLMKDASIQDINQGDKSVLKVKEKLVLEKTDEQASRDFQNLINDTARSVMPVLNDILHGWANYWRD